MSLKPAKCGHLVDLPGFDASNFVCKDCFGFAYTTNSYRDLDDKRHRAGIGEAVRHSPTVLQGVRHGTHWAYKQGCRCYPCAERQRVAAADRRARAAA